ncbi:5'-nucleotidase/2',3'-cyclic phosphodiesterase-like hydrolase [Beggiatoa alba B18LD]|uniref:5'-nucleotidase/2',3'-cyclic phosphodiesterase-like hydrolase n=1 Tax=Beggiatoa alba B18LD TaxID=395493 RepID=I3CGR8_9GAMM|nr:5'-nucleotidase C-terminal domain-containing protein [Beggiatoa alba]EIJ42811.1 5'-nucleotidase/2',3'-cyclic phosphodiesterase-like hydrolase [Beggiatoa alba B18LD]
MRIDDSPSVLVHSTDRHQQTSSTSCIVLKQANPNPRGGFKTLYLLAGDFVQADLPICVQTTKDITFPVCTLQPDRIYTLRIFHLNDLHHELRSTHPELGDTHRFSQMVKYVNQARAVSAQQGDVLFISVGDDHIGNPFDELLGTDAHNFQLSAAYYAYSAAGLDAGVIGNHELDRGSALLAKAIIQNANFPLLSANLYGSCYLGAAHYSPALIGVTANGLRVGMVGLTTVIATRLGTKDDPDFKAEDVLSILRRVLPVLAPQVDIVLLLSHVGYNGVVNGTVRHALACGDVDVARVVAELAIEKPILLIGGHTHTQLNTAGLETYHYQIPVAQAGGYGSHLGEILIQVSPSLTSRKPKVTIEACLHPIKLRDETARLQAGYDPTQYEQESDIDSDFETTIMSPLYKKLQYKLGEVIGYAGDLADLQTAQIIQTRYRGQLAIANFMNDAIVARSFQFPRRADGSQQVDFAVFNASGICQGVKPAHPITYNDWYKVMPFADLIVVVTMTGQEVQQLLMSNAQRLVRPEQVVSQAELAGYAVSYGFLHFSRQVRYQIVLGATTAQASAQQIYIHGQPIESVLTQKFRVAFGDFVALRGAGGENWKGQTRQDGRPALGFDVTALAKEETGLVYHDEIIKFIREYGVVDSLSGVITDERLSIVSTAY